MCHQKKQRFLFKQRFMRIIWNLRCILIPCSSIGPSTAFSLFNFLSVRCSQPCDTVPECSFQLCVFISLLKFNILVSFKAFSTTTALKYYSLKKVSPFWNHFPCSKLNQLVWFFWGFKYTELIMEIFKNSYIVQHGF